MRRRRRRRRRRLNVVAQRLFPVVAGSTARPASILNASTTAKKSRDAFPAATAMSRAPPTDRRDDLCRDDLRSGSRGIKRAVESHRPTSTRRLRVRRQRVMGRRHARHRAVAQDGLQDVQVREDRRLAPGAPERRPAGRHRASTSSTPWFAGRRTCGPRSPIGRVTNWGNGNVDFDTAQADAAAAADGDDQGVRRREDRTRCSRAQAPRLRR